MLEIAVNAGSKHSWAHVAKELDAHNKQLLSVMIRKIYK